MHRAQAGDTCPEVQFFDQILVPLVQVDRIGMNHPVRTLLIDLPDDDWLVVYNGLEQHGIG